jgi:hypothetical protein
VDADAFPADFAAFARYGPALRSLPSATVPWSPLSLADLLAGLDAAPRISVTRPDRSPPSDPEA